MAKLITTTLRLPESLRERINREAKLRAQPFDLRPSLTLTVVELLTSRLDQLDAERAAHRSARKVGGK